MEIDDRLKSLLKKLGTALHNAMADSDAVKDVTQEIRNQGYNLFLVMEANIALEKKENKEPGELFFETPEPPISIKMTKFDEAFLSGMQIKIDDNNMSEP